MTYIISLVALFVTSPAIVPAQRWSTQQQEIIDQVRRCNDGWVASIEQRRFEAFDAVCPQTADAVFWYSAADRPVPYRGSNGFWSSTVAGIRSESWRDLQPVAVNVEGDLALIYYSVTWTLVPNTGEARDVPSRRLTVFQRRNGRWLMAGGTIAPASPVPRLIPGHSDAQDRHGRSPSTSRNAIEVEERCLTTTSRQESGPVGWARCTAASIRASTGPSR